MSMFNGSGSFSRSLPGETVAKLQEAIFTPVPLRFSRNPPGPYTASRRVPSARDREIDPVVSRTRAIVGPDAGCSQTCVVSNGGFTIDCAAAPKDPRASRRAVGTWARYVLGAGDVYTRPGWSLPVRPGRLTRTRWFDVAQVRSSVWKAPGASLICLTKYRLLRPSRGTTMSHRPSASVVQRAQSASILCCGPAFSMASRASLLGLRG
ncbi:hypothetical protein CXF45_03170 [Corynebacterium bovis]|nr:hypothetical protein CXF38_10015 [Corynebacterium bovis]RRO83356.1 hypothetical protein CXF36_03330 [Corynebacterium bovis]RRO91670.1 hypothetical protein CXF45_03170 [Corynebacterium bovis]